jgi:hypothetical protein
VNESPVDHILGVLAKLDATAVAPAAGTPPEVTCPPPAELDPPANSRQLNRRAHQYRELSPAPSLAPVGCSAPPAQILRPGVVAVLRWVHIRLTKPGVGGSVPGIWLLGAGGAPATSPAVWPEAAGAAGTVSAVPKNRHPGTSERPWRVRVSPVSGWSRGTGGKPVHASRSYPSRRERARHHRISLLARPQRQCRSARKHPDRRFRISALAAQLHSRDLYPVGSRAFL